MGTETLFLEILDPQIPRLSYTSSLCVQLIQTHLIRLKFGDTGCTVVFVVLEFHGLCCSVHHLVLESGGGRGRETGRTGGGRGTGDGRGKGGKRERNSKRQAFVICYCLHLVKETDPTTFLDFHLSFSEA